MLLAALVLVLSTQRLAADENPSVHEVGQVKSKQLREISGLAASRLNPSTLWVHNDGGARMLVAVDVAGKPSALVSWPIEIADFEDVAIGPGPKDGIDYLYVGDIGDNDSKRRQIRVVRFAEPKISEARSGQVEVEGAEEFRLKYPDRPHNAEALIVDPIGRSLFIVTKEPQNARLYSCPFEKLEDKGLSNLEYLGTLDVRRISGGAISRDGNRIILRSEDQGWLWERGSGQGILAALKTRPRKIPVRTDNQGQNGEAVAFRPDGLGYYTVSEGKDQKICEFTLPAATVPPKR